MDKIQNVLEQSFFVKLLFIIAFIRNLSDTYLCERTKCKMEYLISRLKNKADKILIYYFLWNYIEINYHFNYN